LDVGWSISPYSCAGSRDQLYPQFSGSDDCDCGDGYTYPSAYYQYCDEYGDTFKHRYTYVIADRWFSHGNADSNGDSDTNRYADEYTHDYCYAYYYQYAYGDGDAALLGGPGDFCRL
jgi:hypothetical protein